MFVSTFSASLSLDISRVSSLAPARPSLGARMLGWAARRNRARLAAHQRTFVDVSPDRGRSLTLDWQHDTAAERLTRLRATTTGTIDTVVSIGALADSADIKATLAEIKRVLGRGARLVFVEPVAAAVGTRRRRLQRALGRVWRLVVGSATAPRDLWNDLKAARFDQLAFRRVDVRGFGGVRVPHLVGEASVSTTRPAVAVSPRGHRAPAPTLALSQPAFAFFG
jgi:hypothetical protein